MASRKLFHTEITSKADHMLGPVPPIHIRKRRCLGHNDHGAGKSAENSLKGRRLVHAHLSYVVGARTGFALAMQE